MHGCTSLYPQERFEKDSDPKPHLQDILKAQPLRQQLDKSDALIAERVNNLQMRLSQVSALAVGMA